MRAISFAVGVGVGVLIGLVFCVIFSSVLTHAPSYRRGQIDALTGKVKYHLVEQEDKSVKWEPLDAE